MRTIAMSDQAIAEAVGERVEALRLKKNLSQEVLAQESGISRQTLRNLLNGKGTLLNLISVLRALDELDRLGSLIQEVRSSPIQMARMAGKKRVRASSPRNKDSEVVSATGRKPLIAPAGKKDTSW